jgi:hypothetical protein
MITNNTYYKGNLYIPQARPSITDEATDSGSDFALLLGTYEEDCLIRCLGPALYREFIAELDTKEANLLKAGSDEKWDRLLNGYNYSKSGETDTVYWKGIRFKSPVISDKYNASFLANYVYYFYERRQHITNTETGQLINEVQNGVVVPPTQKVSDAWNKFVAMVQGVREEESVYYKTSLMGFKTGLIGVDYYNGGQEISLYEFISDMNEITEDYYSNFLPTIWELVNRFGL